MKDIKTRLSALLIEYKYTQSRKALQEVTNLLAGIESEQDYNSFKSFFTDSKNFAN